MGILHTGTIKQYYNQSENQKCISEEIYIIIYLILFNIKYDSSQIEKARLGLKEKDLDDHNKIGLGLG